MRVVGVVLAVGVAVLYPSAAKADPIKLQAAVVSSSLEARIAPINTTDQNGAVLTAQHSEQVAVDGNMGAFVPRSSLEQSAYFANFGSAQLFADERSSFTDTISTEGLGVNLQTHVTIALRAGETMIYTGPQICCVERVPDVDPSTTPEPGSLLLIATGLGGLLLYRRQLLA